MNIIWPIESKHGNTATTIIFRQPAFQEVSHAQTVNHALYHQARQLLLSKTDVSWGGLQGRQSGNVLLRRAQYRVSEQNPVPVARNIIAAKIQASKRVLQRQIRNYGENAAIQSAVDALNISLRQLKGAAELGVVCGIESGAAARYFGVFRQLLSEKSGFSFDERSRRPPKDGVNALLSFVYSILGKISAVRYSRKPIRISSCSKPCGPATSGSLY